MCTMLHMFSDRHKLAVEGHVRPFVCQDASLSLQVAIRSWSSVRWCIMLYAPAIIVWQVMIRSRSSVAVFVTYDPVLHGWQTVKVDINLSRLIVSHVYIYYIEANRMSRRLSTKAVTRISK